MPRASAGDSAQTRPEPRTKHEERSTGVGELAAPPRIAVLTSGRDKPYALGLADALLDRGIAFEFLGSTEVDSPHLHGAPGVTVRNFRDQQEGAGPVGKVARVIAMYARLFAYAVTARPKLFHILWTNKVEWFDRTVLMAWYRLCGRRLVFTAHNVNKAKRDGNDSAFNRWNHGVLYGLSDHVFVHTGRMRDELQAGFGVPDDRVSVIPFGINSTVPDTGLDRGGARSRLGLSPTDDVLVFFGNIAPYKGVEYLVEAFLSLAEEMPNLRLVIGGRIKGAEEYWREIEVRIESSGFADRVLRRTEYIPDEETEVYFKAADAFALPYTHIFQSGVLFLGYNFGVPVIATDVGSLADDIVPGETGLVCRPEDAADLARCIREFFASPLGEGSEARRDSIRSFAREKYSWDKVGEITEGVYRRVLGVGD